MSRKRLKEILNNLLSWGFDHDKEFVDCMISSMNLSVEEIIELGLAEWLMEGV